MKQVEDEISVVSMAIGAMHVGTRALWDFRRRL